MTELDPLTCTPDFVLNIRNKVDILIELKKGIIIIGCQLAQKIRKTKPSTNCPKTAA